MFFQDGNALIFKKRGEIVRIEGWGKNALRIRATRNNEFTGNLWALCPKDELSADKTGAEIKIAEDRSYIKNGSIGTIISQDSFGQGHDPIAMMYNHIVDRKPFPAEVISCRASVADASNIDDLIEG